MSRTRRKVRHENEQAKELICSKKKVEIARLYMEARSQAAIAEQMGLSINTVAKYLREIREEWKQEYKELWETKKAEQLAKIDRVEEEAWDAWFRSCGEQITTKRTVREYRENVDSPRGGHVMVPIEQNREQVVRQQNGDPRFLERIQWCIEMRVKILGLIKASDHQTTVNINWGQFIQMQRQGARPLGDTSAPSAANLPGARAQPTEVQALPRPRANPVSERIRSILEGGREAQDAQAVTPGPLPQGPDLPDNRSREIIDVGRAKMEEDSLYTPGAPWEEEEPEDD